MAKKLKLLKPLSSAEFDMLRRARVDPFEFSKHVRIVHPMHGRVPFHLYKYQEAVLLAFLKNRFTILKKFRQAGITELIAMYCLWYAMYNDNKNVVIISIKDRVAKKVLRRIKYMYMNLPEFLKVPIANGRGDDIGTATELEFVNGSLITSVPTTEEAGRSEAVSLLVIDEAAIVRWIHKIWASAFPTLSTGGKAIVNSTPYGVGNWYHKTWVQALSGEGSFVPLNLKWQMHPERDMEWYKVMAEELGPRKTAQEVDGDFLTSGNSVFDLRDIKAIEDELSDYPPVETREGGRLRIYRHWEKGDICTIGADIATGRGNDFSAFSCMNQHGEELASFKGKVSIFQMADLLASTGKEYHNALLAPEANDIGLGTVEKLQHNGYPNIYFSKAILKKKGAKKVEEKNIAGWYTKGENRSIIINELEEDLRKENITIKDPEFVREAYTFIYDNANRPVALGKTNTSDADDLLDNQVYNDDAILAKAITNRVRKTIRKNPIILPY